MKKAVMALQTAIVAYDGLSAHPILPTALKTSEMRKIGRRPYRFEIGCQISGATPRIATKREVRYVVV